MECFKVLPPPHDLVEAAKNGNLVIFAGAGISKDNKKEYSCDKMPGWNTLLVKIADKIGIKDNSDFTNLLDNNLLEAAEFLKYYASHNSLTSDFYSVIEGIDNGFNVEHNEWYKKIAFLNPSIIVTTNYDSLLERYFKDGYASYSPREDQDIAAISRNIKLKKPTLLKIHGDTKNGSIENIVITQSDYSRNIIKNPGYYRILQSLLDTRVFLFIGYSMGDPDFQILLHNTLSASSIGNKSIKTHFMLVSNPKPYYKNMLEDSFGISVIGYPAPEISENEYYHEEGKIFLQSLIDAIQVESQ